jgi:hypothetical protein
VPVRVAGRKEGVMEDEHAAIWSIGDVVYATYLVVVALAWVAIPAALALAGR